MPAPGSGPTTPSTGVLPVPQLIPSPSSPPPLDIESEGWKTESDGSGDNPLWGESHYHFLTGYGGPELNAGRHTPGGSNIYGDPVEFDLLEEINNDLLIILFALIEGQQSIFQAIQGAPG